MAAGISVTWYTWLEQGRSVRVSGRTLRAVGRALRLTPPERTHLLGLATAALGNGRRMAVTRESGATLRAVVMSLEHPAYAVNGLWDVLCRNRLADAVFGDFDREPGRTDNIMRRLLLDPDWREQFVNWESIAASAIAQFRASTGHLVGHPTWQPFVATLCAESPWFAERWSAHAIAPAVSLRLRPERFRRVDAEPAPRRPQRADERNHGHQRPEDGKEVTSPSSHQLAARSHLDRHRRRNA